MKCSQIATRQFVEGERKWLTLKTAEMRCETDAAGKSKATEVFPENKIKFAVVDCKLYSRFL